MNRKYQQHTLIHHEGREGNLLTVMIKKVMTWILKFYYLMLFKALLIMLISFFCVQKNNNILAYVVNIVLE